MQHNFKKIKKHHTGTIAFIAIWIILLILFLTCIIYHNRKIIVNGTLAEQWRKEAEHETSHRLS